MAKRTARPDRLYVLLGGDRCGTVHRDRRGRCRFRYDPAWLAADTGLRLSQSMPLEDVDYPHPLIDAWMWGVLPDNRQVLERWARRLQVSPNNAFGLLSTMGEDCAGAVQFVLPEREEQVRNDGDVQWLTDTEVAERLQALREDAAATRRDDDLGMFSLAGAQAKTALHHDTETGRWGVPYGVIPTTHILKPPMPEFDGQVENEYLCLRVAEAIGIPTAESRVMRFGAETAIVIRRYDRVRREGRWQRVHQEDGCQALGVHPASKYENEGGPGVGDIARLLDASDRVERDRDSFLRAQILNHLLAATDGHAKNYSMLMNHGWSLRLAPLYDINSAYPYLDVQKLHLAMGIGGERRQFQVMPRHWQRLARDMDMPGRHVLETVAQMCEILPGTVESVAEDCARDGIRHAVFETIIDGVAATARRQLEWLAKTR